MSAPINLSSSVRAVTVYRRGALVTREARLEPSEDAFPRRIQLVGLPLTLDDSSVRVEVEAAEGSGVGPIAGDLRVTLAVPEEEPELPPPSNEELDRAKLEHDQASDVRDHLLRAQARLAKLQPGRRGKPEEGKAPAASPTTARLELLGFRRERDEALTTKLEAAHARVRETKQHLDTLRERERLASSQRNAREHELRKAAIIEILSPDTPGTSKGAERAIVRLHYFVPGARWAPAYTVRLDETMTHSSLELRAMVGQATGEDWRDVALTLSTASPQQWTELPRLESRRIGRRQPPPPKTGWRPPPVGAEELYADFDRGLGEPEPAPKSEPRPSASPQREKTEESVMFDLDDLAKMAGMADDQPVHEFQAKKRKRSEDLSRSIIATGAPPPAAAPQSMPMPQATRSGGPDANDMTPPAPLMAEAAPKRSAGLGALVGGAIDGIASAFADHEGYGGGAPGYGGAPMDKLLEPELLAGRELLDYGRLRLFPGSSARRGALRRIDLRMHYEQVAVERVHIEVAIAQIREAVEWARLLETETPPERHRWPTSEAGFDYAYVADARVDLRSTGGFESLPILQSEAEATPRYVSVPRETQDVFRIVKLQNPLDAPLLPGPADVYVGGKFTLSSDLDLTPRGGRIELGLGVEQAIKIARNVEFNEDSSGMFKRSLELNHAIRVEVQNHLPRAAEVEVRERLPVAHGSQEDDIEISLGSVSPPWNDYEPERPPHDPLEGGKRWRVEVPAGGKQKLEASWTVRIPSNNELVGGNRRES